MMQDKMMTVEECCYHLGIGKSLLYEILNAKEIESFKIGRKRVISKASADAFLAQRSTCTTPEGRAG